jgi:hypothetical protein
VLQPAGLWCRCIPHVVWPARKHWLHAMHMHVVAALVFGNQLNPQGPTTEHRRYEPAGSCSICRKEYGLEAYKAASSLTL